MNWDYIAGIIDGEGSIVHLSGQSYRITFAQNDLGILGQIQTFLNDYGIYSWIVKKKPSKQHPNSIGYHLAFAKSTGVRLFLNSLKDRVVVKRSKLLETLDNLTTRTTTPVSQKEVNAMVTLSNEGLSQYEIGEILGRSQGVISSNLKRRRP